MAVAITDSHVLYELIATEDDDWDGCNDEIGKWLVGLYWRTCSRPSRYCAANRISLRRRGRRCDSGRSATQDDVPGVTELSETRTHRGIDVVDGETQLLGVIAEQTTDTTISYVQRHLSCGCQWVIAVADACDFSKFSTACGINKHSNTNSVDIQHKN